MHKYVTPPYHNISVSPQHHQCAQQDSLADGTGVSPEHPPSAEGVAESAGAGESSRTADHMSACQPTKNYSNPGCNRQTVGDDYIDCSWLLATALDWVCMHDVVACQQQQTACRMCNHLHGLRMDDACIVCANMIAMLTSNKQQWCHVLYLHYSVADWPRIRSLHVSCSCLKLKTHIAVQANSHSGIPTHKTSMQIAELQKW